MATCQSIGGLAAYSDIFQKICHKLHPQAVNVCALVSKEWNAAINNNDLWKSLCMRDFTHRVTDDITRSTPVYRKLYECFYRIQSTIKLMEEAKTLSTSDLNLARARLFELLSHDELEIQQKAFAYLNPLFALDYLEYDIQNSSAQLAALEQRLRQLLKTRYAPPLDIILSVLHLYYDLVERLWFIASLTEDPECHHSVGEHISTIPSDAELWMTHFEKFSFTHPIIGSHLQSLRALFKRTTQEKPDLFTRARIYRTIGIRCDSLGKFREAIEFHKKYLQIVISLPDQIGEGAAYGSLGKDHFNLNEYEKAIEYYEKYLQIAISLKDRAGEGAAYKELGNAHCCLGEYHKAITFHEKCLQIAISRKDPAEEGAAYNNLGSAYFYLAKYRKATELFEQSLQIAIFRGDQKGQGSAYGNLGDTAYNLGEYIKAIDFHQKCLEIAISLKDRAGIGQACNNLGNAHFRLHEYPQAITYYEQSLQFAISLKDPVAERRAYGNLGSTYNTIHNHPMAIEFHNKDLQIAISLQDPAGIGKAYGNLGNVYFNLGNYLQAIEFHNKNLQIAQKSENGESEGIAYYNLGSAYALLPDMVQSETCYRNSLAARAKVYAQLGTEAQWKITYFETIASTYTSLESLFLTNANYLKALEISDERRSRALIASLSRRLLSSNLSFSLAPLNSQEMQKLAQKLKTVFIIYSWQTFKKEGQNHITAWVVPLDGEISWHPIPIHGLPAEAKEESKLLKTFPYVKVRALKGQTSPSLMFQDRLSQWYESLISPIEPYFPKNSEQTLTIVPDGVLHYLPFAIFQDKRGKYLIEKYPVAIAPSLKVLQLLEILQASPQNHLEGSLVIANPTTPNPEDNQLKVTKKEAKTVTDFFNTSSEHILTETNATVDRAFKGMLQSRLIHLSCHGLSGVTSGETLEDKPDRYSVFEGLLKLAADEKHLNGYLHSHEIAFAALRAELVFMTACHSGRGGLKQEGNIGLIWSFLAAGASSVIASYWPVPDMETTAEMVETFYSHLLGRTKEGDAVEKLNKARALQKAILQAMEKERDNPKQWGVFFLSGLV